MRAAAESKADFPIGGGGGGHKVYCIASYQIVSRHMLLSATPMNPCSFTHQLLELPKEQRKTWTEMHLPADKMGLHIRGGAVLPTQAPAVTTTYRYHRQPTDNPDPHTHTTFLLDPPDHHQPGKKKDTAATTENKCRNKIASFNVSFYKN